MIRLSPEGISIVADRSVSMNGLLSLEGTSLVGVVIGIIPVDVSIGLIVTDSFERTSVDVG